METASVDHSFKKLGGKESRRAWKAGRVMEECSRVRRTVYRLGEKEWRDEVEDQSKERLVDKIMIQHKGMSGARD